MSTTCYVKFTKTSMHYPALTTAKVKRSPLVVQIQQIPSYISLVLFIPLGRHVQVRFGSVLVRAAPGRRSGRHRQRAAVTNGMARKLERLCGGNEADSAEEEVGGCRYHGHVVLKIEMNCGQIVYNTSRYSHKIHLEVGGVDGYNTTRYYDTYRSDELLVSAADC